MGAPNIYNAMKWGAEPEIQSMFNFWNSPLRVDQVSPQLPEVP